MKKTIGLVMALILVLISLTGCVNINYEVKVNKNGSGDISYIYGFSKETLNSLQMTAEDMVKSMKEQAEESKYTVETYEDDEIAGFKAQKHVDDLSSEMSMQEAFGEEYVKDKEGNGINIKKSLFTREYSQNVQIDLTSLSDLGDSVKMTYKVTLPAKSKTNNATEVKGKELTWKLKAGEVNQIEFTAIGINILPIIIIVLVILIVAGAVITFVILKKKKGTKK